MKVERQDNGDLCLYAINGDPLLKLQAGEPPFITVVQGDHPPDVRSAKLSEEAIEAMREFCEEAEACEPR